MKLPSIIKIPSYQKFNYEPRFYDPIKEDIDQRTARVKRRIAADKKAGLYTGARLEGAFARRIPHERYSSLIRLTVGIILFSGVVGFLYFGNVAIYITITVVIGFVIFNKFFQK